MKGQIYEGGHRIPLMMRWDNGPIPKGETRSHLVGLNDIYATLCQLTGVDVPENQGIDSVGFADYIQNVQATQNLRKNLGVWRFKDGSLLAESIRKDNLKLIKNYDGGQMNLYDLDTDIGETTDLIDDSSYAQDVNEMLVALEKISPCYDNRESFNVTDGNGILQEKTCEWFRDAKWRCNDYDEGHIECRYTCGVNTKSACLVEPSTSPSIHPSSPTSSSVQPSTNQSSEPSGLLTMQPSHTLSHSPSVQPTNNPTASTTLSPSIQPTNNPTASITLSPSIQPTIDADATTSSPSLEPGTNTTTEPTILQTFPPSHTSTNMPSTSPSLPVPVPQRNCNDSTLRFRINWNSKWITRGCTWIGNKQTVERCNIAGVRPHCSKTCDSCSTCTDSTLRIKLMWNGNLITRSCIWVANKSTILRCAVEGVANSCRKTCGVCS